MNWRFLTLISISFWAFSLSTFSRAVPQELGAGTKATTLYYHYPPDPVNPRTLNFYLPVEHLTLPCYVPIEVKAAYNSYASDSSIFGDKWTFNYNVRVQSARTKYAVLEGDGFLNTYTREKNLEEAKKVLIEQLLVARKKKDSQSGGLKAPTVYEEYKRQLQNDAAFRDEQEAKLITNPKPLEAGKYYSFARGFSTLEKKADGSFVRSFQNGAAEYFDRDGHLVKTMDRNGNFLNYIYNGDNLIRINDMCGRYVTFSYKADKALKGLVDGIRDSLGREIKYDFFSNRRLKSFIDPQKRVTEYVYDKLGNMTSIAVTTPIAPGQSQKETLTFEYNERSEVIRQIGPGTEESRFERTFVGKNPSHSITKISKYENKKLLGREDHEYKLQESEITTKFDAAGNELKREVRTLSPETGYPKTVVDGSGRGERYDYDAASGNLMKKESIPPGETIQFEYDTKCNQVKKMTMSQVKQAPVVAEFKFDDYCNLREAIETQSEKKRVWIGLEYNPKGKISFLHDKILGKDVAFTYWQYGKPDSITLKDLGTLLVRYSPLGEIVKVETFPHGEGKKKFAKSEPSAIQSTILSEVRIALDAMLGYLKPAGINIGL